MGINYVRINFGTVQHQAAAARLLLPLLDPDVRPVEALV